MLLLHVCCADCTLKLLDAVSRETGMPSHEIHLYYYDPNIHPQMEYEARRDALKSVSGKAGVKLIIPNWKPGDYFAAMKGIPWEGMPGNPARCKRCWSLRLGQSFAYAAAHGYGAVSTTLLSSKYMERATIESIGYALARKYGLEFVAPKDILCGLNTFGFYKQNYCGCLFSLNDRMKEKYG